MSAAAEFLRPLSALPAAKATLARRLLMTGRAVDPDQFARAGIPLSQAQRDLVAVAERDALATRVVQRARSADGSVRMVVACGDGHAVECVAMPVGAVCLSTQVGCAVRCSFCASGRDGLLRNLTAREIVEQLVHARREMRVDRVVFMGMGEPGHNLDAVLQAVACIKADALIGPKRQTVSTVGSRRTFRRMAAAAVRPCLALSLHAADSGLRRRLLPHAADEPLEELVRGADDYGRSVGMPIQIEWTLLAGVNDGDADVEALIDLVRGCRGYVNFIAWNPVSGVELRGTPRARIVELVERVKHAGILATARFSAGADVDAACGQLRLRAP